MRTAEQIFNELQHIPTAEQQRFFAILAQKALQQEESEQLTHQALFGDLENAFFTAKEAMEYLEISSATFRRYIRDGKIYARKELGRSQLFALDDLRELKNALRKVKG